MGHWTIDNGGDIILQVSNGADMTVFAENIQELDSAENWSSKTGDAENGGTNQDETSSGFLKIGGGANSLSITNAYSLTINRQN